MDEAHARSLTAPTRAPVERRQFLRMTSCATGFAAAAGPVNAQVITTPADGLVAGETKVPSLGVDLPAYRAYPAKGGPFPTIVVIHEVFGVHEHIKDVVLRLAKAGYYAIAPELFAREGDPSKVADIGRLMTEIVAKVPDAQVALDVDNAIAFAKASGDADTTKLGVIGFCWGGRQVWLQCAHNPAYKAAAVFYGPLGGKADPLHPKTVFDIIKTVKTPVLGAYGGSDAGITMDQIEQARADLKEAGAPSEIDVYPGAPHGFFADYRPSYRKEAAQEAWRKALAWFSAHGVR